MRLLTFTNLYPSDEMPGRGIFVEERLRHLVQTGEVSASVIALRPRFPVFGANPCRSGTRSGIPVEYVGVPTLPKLTNWVDPVLWASAAKAAVGSILQQSHGPVVLDAHFLYPDGAAAAILGRSFGIPVVLTALGNDVYLKCRNPVMRAWLKWAVAKSAAVITVSASLSKQLKQLGVRPSRVEVIRNGVDLEKFPPKNRQVTRNRLGISGTLLLTVGHLIERKGNHIAISALTEFPDATLLIVGDGPSRASLVRQARRPSRRDPCAIPGQDSTFGNARSVLGGRRACAGVG